VDLPVKYQPQEKKSVKEPHSTQESSDIPSTSCIYKYSAKLGKERVESFDAAERSADMATETLVTGLLPDIQNQRENSPENILRAEIISVISVIKSLFYLAAIGENIMDKGDKHKECIHDGNNRDSLLAKGGHHNHQDQADKQDGGADLA